jgi:hypothetical protein
MVSLLSLWLPILLSAVLVFVVSSIIHMFLPYHRNDYRRLPDEDGVMGALRPFAVPPGDYMFPRAGSMKEMGSPEYLARHKAGPVALITVLPSGKLSMTGSLVLWFVYSLVVSGFAGYIAGRALAPDAHYLAVFRFAGTTAFLAYAGAQWQNSIWFGRSWATTLRNTVDGLIYGLVTAGVFGWLWP